MLLFFYRIIHLHKAYLAIDEISQEKEAEPKVEGRNHILEDHKDVGVVSISVSYS